MIAFTCPCGEKLEVPAELAGELMQCPRCLRLTDVPRFHNINGIEDDGTLRLQDEDETPPALDSKFRAFGGRDDMRGTVDEFVIRNADDPTVPTPRAAPRYDAITGELLLPVEIANDDAPPPPPPVEFGSPVLGYARSQVVDGAAARSVPWWSMPWRLLTGWSLMAMIFVWAVHAFVVVGLATPGFNIFFILIAFAIAVVIAGHYANTMEDFGPNDKDRVPVLFRSVSLSEDVWYPLWSILLAAGFSFGPTVLAMIFTPRSIQHAYPWVLTIIFLGWGLLWFPVAVFTVVCGGVWQNLSPPRMWSVLAAGPGRYVLAALTFYLACATYLFTMGMMTFGSTNVLPTATAGQFLQDLRDTAIVMGLFAVPVYLMHLAAAWFGLFYRMKFERFDWVLQRHERTIRHDTAAELMKRRVQRADPPAAPRKGFEVKI